MAVIPKFKWISIFLVFMFVATENLYAGESCQAGGTQGICKLLSECPALDEEIRKSGSPMPTTIRRKLQSLMCGFQNEEPIICCAITSGASNPVETVNNPGTMNHNGNNVISRNKGPVDVRNHRNRDLLPTNCGLTDSDRILGGNRTVLYEMPWMALISYDSPRGKKLSCGGTLINEWYVLTAAHCVSFLGNRLTLAGVVIGEYDIRSDPDCERVEGDLQCAPSVVNATIAEVIAHPGYSPQKLTDDVALIRLSNIVDFTLYSMKPICLPVTPELQMETLVGTKGVVAGWGATEDGLQSPVLLSVDVPILSNDECEKAYKMNISDQQLCAGGVQGKDSCAGDSGGPLMYRSVGTRQVQRGIVSFGSKRCGIGGYPGIYTNIAYYMDWILDNMRE